MHEFAIDTNNPDASFNVKPPSSNRSDNDSTDVNDLIASRIKANKRFFGIEISPAASGNELDYGKFTVAQPLFTAVTWLTDDNLQFDSLSKAPAIQLGKIVEKCNPVVMHLTCNKLSQSQLNELLDLGFRNVLALKGGKYTTYSFHMLNSSIRKNFFKFLFIPIDFSHASSVQNWTHAIDLVKAIRSIRADGAIGVAGYAEVHRLAKSRNDDLQWLKAKVDAGANFVITNMCFSFEHLIGFIRSCRAVGISVPIIPGIFVPTSYDALQKMCNICHVDVPSDQLELFEQYKTNDAHFRAYAIENAVRLLTQLFTFDEFPIYGVQFFTLNKYDHILAVVEKCNQFFGS